MLCVGFALLIAYFINVRKQNVYRLSSLISVENDQNPFFTANTSISFNWGGVSGKVGKILTEIKTRTHNEKVVDSLQYYMQYLSEGKYRKVDIYGKTPFTFEPDLSKPQLLNTPIGIRFIDNNSFEVFTSFENEHGQAQRYDTKEKFNVILPVGDNTKTYKVGEAINTSFFNGVLDIKPGIKVKEGAEYFMKFLEAGLKY